MKFVLFGGVCLFVFLGRTLCLILSQGSFLKKKNVFRKKHLSITTTRHPNHEGKTHLECSLSFPSLGAVPPGPRRRAPRCPEPLPHPLAPGRGGVDVRGSAGARGGGGAVRPVPVALGRLCRCSLLCRSRAFWSLSGARGRWVSWAGWRRCPNSPGRRRPGPAVPGGGPAWGARSRAGPPPCPACRPAAVPPPLGRRASTTKFSGAPWRSPRSSGEQSPSRSSGTSHGPGPWTRAAPAAPLGESARVPLLRRRGRDRHQDRNRGWDRAGTAEHRRAQLNCSGQSCPPRGWGVLGVGAVRLTQKHPSTAFGGSARRQC